MITQTGARRNATVLDFGVAGFMKDVRGQDYVTLTAAGTSPGTPGYMAPEQIRGEEVTPQSDIYSWGLVFLECLTGRFPLDGSSLNRVLVQHLSPEPVPIPAYIGEEDYRPVIERAIAKACAERYRSSREAYDELEAVVRGSSERCVEPPATVLLARPERDEAVGGADGDVEPPTSGAAARVSGDETPDDERKRIVLMAACMEAVDGACREVEKY